MTGRALVPLLGAALVVTVLVCSTIGGASIGPGAVLRALARAESGSVDPTVGILVSIRLPRLALGMAVGAGLALSGAAMQGLFRNPLVDPGLLGVQAGAALGAVLAIVGEGALARWGTTSWLGSLLVPAASFAGATIAMLAIRRLARTAGESAATLILAGLGVNALFQALTGLVIHRASEAQLRSITFWNLGSLAGSTWSAVAAMTPCLALGAVILLVRARALDVLALGDAEAGHLGIDANRVRRRVIVAVCLVVGASVASAGALGFVGLVVPHLVRLVAGPGHRTLLSGSALLGAIVLLLADAIARTAALPAELPLGVVTAALGAPFFLVLVARQRRTFT